MNDTAKRQVTTPTDREIVMTRVFDAPRDLVFDAWTKPELLRRWLGVRNGWTFAVCEVDLRVGGAYRYVWRGPEGNEMGMGGVYREVVRPERVVNTEKFDESWYPGEALDTLVLDENDGMTTCTTTVRYESKEARDAAAQTGMATGVEESYEVLDRVLAEMGKRGS
ncbi:MAG: SRPBCC family protein [Chloroflexota bacterium]|nr:SRPBCC family protein [Chloroflexota bacterium]